MVVAPRGQEIRTALVARRARMARVHFGVEERDSEEVLGMEVGR